MNYDIRDASTAQLIEHMKQMEAEYGERGIEGWIIGGDINTNHDDQHGDNVVELLVAEGFWNTWARIPAEERHTWKGRIDRFGPSTLDYIFLKGFGEPDARNYVVPDTVSDHNAVIVTIDLPSAE
jgi:endonuclease/exonuclease/phosphatase (EEP) superfamily protein YafD